jgi:MFS family permease
MAVASPTSAAGPFGEAGYPRPLVAWTVVLILVATAILSYTDRQVLSLLVDPLRGDLHIDDTQVSLLLGSAFAVVYGVAGVPIGWLSDRVSRRNLIAAGVLTWSGGTLCCGMSHSFGELFASRLLVGLGEATLSPSAISLISDYFAPSKRGAAVGLFLSGIAVGVGASIFIGGGVLKLVELGLLAGTPLAHMPVWRLVLLLIGAPGLAWSAVILLIREPVRRGVELVAATPSGPGRWAASHWKAGLPIYAVLAMASLVDNAVGAWAPSLLIRDFGMNPAQVGLELGVLLAVAYGGGVFLGGVLADKVGARGGWRSKLRICLACGLLAIGTAALMAAPNLKVVFIGVPAYFALSGAVTSAGFAALLDVTPSRSRGLAMAVSFFLNVAVGAGLGPTAVAVISDRFMAGKGLGLSICLTVAVGYLLSCGVVLVSEFGSRRALARA